MGALRQGERFAEALRAETPEVTGFALSERLAPSDVAYGERALYGDGRLEERIGDVRLQMGHNAFFQVNTPAAELLYAEAARFAALEELPDPVLWDVYGGVGSIGLYMGRNARVVGIEEMPGAVRYARGNAKALGRKAYKVEQGDAKSVLGRLVKLGPKPDVVVVDPPRAGIDAKVAQQLAEAAPLRLIYVSCNPATLARDVARSGSGFPPESRQACGLVPTDAACGDGGPAGTRVISDCEANDESHRHQWKRPQGWEYFSSHQGGFCGAGGGRH